MIITECGDPFIFLLGFVSQTRTLSLSVSQRLQLGVVLFISFLDLSQRCFLFLFYFPFVKEARCCCCWGKIFSFFFLSIELSSKTEKEKVLFYLNLPFERLCVPRGKASLCLLLYFLRIIRQLFFSSIKWFSTTWRSLISRSSSVFINYPANQLMGFYLPFFLFSCVSGCIRTNTPFTIDAIFHWKAHRIITSQLACFFSSLFTSSPSFQASILHLSAVKLRKLHSFPFLLRRISHFILSVCFFFQAAKSTWYRCTLHHHHDPSLLYAFMHTEQRVRSIYILNHRWM